MSGGLQTRIELNGAPATIDDLRPMLQTNYGHFSTMQVIDGCVRGLTLHLERIEHATRELFGTPIDPDHVRACIRHAVAGHSTALSVRVNIFARSLDRTRPADPAVADVLVMTGARASTPAAPLRLKSFRYTRELPHIKHVGTFALFHYRRLAQQAGFDDAVFVDEDDCISEGSIWNIGFHDEKSVVWPDAPQLTGISLQLLQAGLARAGLAGTTRRIRLADLGGVRAAFFTNSSTPVQPVASIDSTRFLLDPAAMEMLVRCYESNPPERV